ncbi:CoA transferase [Pseudofrankia sp. BMG5.36]|uniref:CoA transferase n=1 Tax=Pseudofrankia sp. BMG5.36 TaxID=1834512 RepID=UPI000AFB9957|nr:CoA transferase [Pseudofrankia sp. BMG5.36]
MAATGARAALPDVLSDWAADLRAGRTGTTSWEYGVEPGWAASGAMALTGHPDAAPLGLTVPFVARLDAALAVIRALAAELGHPFRAPAGATPLPADGPPSARGSATVARTSAVHPADGPPSARGSATVARTSAVHPPASAGQLLGERAAALGLTRGGLFSAGRAARLIRAADGWLAVNLARPDDVDLLPAWLEGDDLEATDADRADSARPASERGQDGAPPPRARPWSALAAAVADRPVTVLTERAELLGLPVALVVDPATAAADAQARARGQRFPFAPFLVDGCPPDTPAGGATRPTAGRQAGARGGTGGVGGGVHDDGGFTVIDLSSLWAGPLCAHLLGLAGGRVVKVEGASRLDGAREGPAAFYDLLHAGHASVTVDLRRAEGRAALVRLIEGADVVLEASRPRALDQLGIGPAAMITRNPCLTWVSITGYGRTGPWRQRPAFGDDAAAAAGAVAVDAAGGPVFLADAVADPVAGVLAAAAALASLAAGGGRHVDVALREAVGSLLAGRPALPDHDPGLPVPPGGGTPFVAAAPCLRAPAGRAAPPGHDNHRLLGAPVPGEHTC